MCGAIDLAKAYSEKGFYKAHLPGKAEQGRAMQSNAEQKAGHLPWSFFSKAVELSKMLLCLGEHGSAAVPSSEHRVICPAELTTAPHVHMVGSIES